MKARSIFLFCLLFVLGAAASPNRQSSASYRSSGQGLCSDSNIEKMWAILMDFRQSDQIRDQTSKVLEFCLNRQLDIAIREFQGLYQAE